MVPYREGVACNVGEALHGWVQHLQHLKATCQIQAVDAKLAAGVRGYAPELQAILPKAPEVFSQ